MLWRLGSAPSVEPRRPILHPCGTPPSYVCTCTWGWRGREVDSSEWRAAGVRGRRRMSKTWDFMDEMRRTITANLVQTC
jgi:hypothetical protein